MGDKMTDKERALAINIIQFKLLQKFLNDPKRLSMTEEEQKAHIDKIEAMT